LIVNTQRLFAGLLSGLRINVICDVGSMNGADALGFRDAISDSSIYAFEPNPQNFRQMQMDQVFVDRNIQLVPLAATNVDGDAELFLVDADYTRRDFRRGMSSLYKRPGEQGAAMPVRVKTTRLDTFLLDKCRPDARLALWIDTEGKAYEVIEGMTGIADRVQLLHVEVEAMPCIGTTQRLYSEVKTLLNELGFAECATDLPSSSSLVQCTLHSIRSIGHDTNAHEGKSGACMAASSAAALGAQSLSHVPSPIPSDATAGLRPIAICDRHALQ
jgi:FkbM family methyltransferase